MHDYLFPVNKGRIKFLISLLEIKYFDAKGAYTLIHTFDGNQYIKSWNIGRVERFVELSKLFLRIHESHLVNIRYINWLEKPQKGKCPMTDGTYMGLARRRKRIYNRIALSTAGK
jgi:two-component system, LytTR family, response regulator